jgi:hypothetical protein
VFSGAPALGGCSPRSRRQHACHRRQLARRLPACITPQPPHLPRPLVPLLLHSRRGWLNTNATWRDITSQRAASLTAVYDSIIAANASSYSHFDMYRLQVDFVALINEYVANGGTAFDVVEPVDGFHPSQTGNYLLADVVFKDLQANRPGWLPSENPFNAQIEAIFGDPGGYSPARAGRGGKERREREGAPSERRTSILRGQGGTRRRGAAQRERMRERQAPSERRTSISTACFDN